MDVVALPLAPGVRHRLQCAGFRTTADLAAVAGPVELATGGYGAARLAGVNALGALTWSRTHAHRGRRARCGRQRGLPKSGMPNTHHRPPAGLRTPTAEAQLTHEEALLALKLAAPHRVAPPGGAGAAGGGGAAGAAPPLSARQIAERERAAKAIITFAPELDRILGGGVETGAITEFWCAPLLGAGGCRHRGARSAAGSRAAADAPCRPAHPACLALCCAPVS